MAKIKCLSRLIHSGNRFEAGDTVDTEKAGMDAETVKKLRADGVLAPTATKPAPAAPPAVKQNQNTLKSIAKAAKDKGVETPDTEGKSNDELGAILAGLKGE